MDVNDNFTQSVHQAQMDRIAELEAENERLRGICNRLTYQNGHYYIDCIRADLRFDLRRLTRAERGGE
jgi:hypothetical protein